MKSKSSAIVAVAVSACLVAGLACQPTRSGPSSADQQQLITFQEKREARGKELKTMDVAGLAATLETESQNGKEWFNSMAFTELVSRGKDASPALTAVLKKKDRSSFSGLMALRKIDPERYRALSSPFRTGVLIDALKNSKYFNAWGIPTSYWTDAARALIEEGSAAERPLQALLHDTRPAPVWGSEGVVVYQQYHFRVCDYAWALLAGIKNSPLEIPESPEARDKLIERMAGK